TELEEDIGPIGRDMATIVEMFERVRNPLGGVLDWLPLPSNRRFKAALKRLDDRVHGMIAARQAGLEVADRFDFLSLLLMARDAHDAGGGGMTDLQVRDEAVTLFMAGHETTANALIWTWLQLAENPPAEAALHAELDEVLAGDRPATADDMPRLRYTRAVLAESMRRRPPAWIIARLCKAPYDVGPYRVPAGTTLLMSQYLVHHDPRWWPEPERFRPERWLEPDGERPKYAYFPFGGGPRSCVGEPFAWLEAILLLATLAKRWRLTRADDTTVRLFPTITLRPKDPVRMTLHRRD
ncbi:MAG TPA: cytochrome P450, partial [Tepidisphaeraceae bacterium]